MKIVYVDGFKIRNKFSLDFNIIRRRSLDGFAPAWYIPKGEIWIEKRLKDETQFLLKTESLERKLSEKIDDFRRVRKIIAKKLCRKHKPPIHGLTLKKYRKWGFMVREVDGGIVRKHFDPLFTIGGHFLTYKYIPKNEIWLDGKMDPKEMKFHLIHETIECALMRGGINYDISHEYATIADKEMRRKDGIVFPGDEDKKSVSVFMPKLRKSAKALGRKF